MQIIGKVVSQRLGVFCIIPIRGYVYALVARRVAEAKHLSLIALLDARVTNRVWSRAWMISADALYAGHASTECEGPSSKKPHIPTEAWFIALSNISFICCAA
jgi:hypothetical protein